jgi:hypothetical protein
MEDALALHRPRAEMRRSRRRGAARQRFTASAAGIVFVGFLIALGLFIVSGPKPAQRIIARAIPTMTEEDSLLGLHAPELTAEAKAAGGKAIALPWFPVTLSLPASVVTSGSVQQVELSLAAHAAATIYEHGMESFAAPGGRDTVTTGPFLSPTWTLHQVTGLLSARTHARLRTVTLLLGLALILLAALFFLQVDGYGRLIGLGTIGVVASLLAGFGTVAVWLLIQFNYNSTASPLGTAAWGMLGDASWTMVLIDLVTLFCSLTLLVIGLLFARLDHPIAEHTNASAGATGRPAMAGRDGVRPRPLDRLPRPPRSSN